MQNSVFGAPESMGTTLTQDFVIKLKHKQYYYNTGEIHKVSEFVVEIALLLYIFYIYQILSLSISIIV
jgi:hypothetical protein